MVSLSSIPPVSVTHKVGLATAAAGLATAAAGLVTAARVVRVPILLLLSTVKLALAGKSGDHLRQLLVHSVVQSGDGR